MTGTIYIALCTVNGKAYVGQTTQPIATRRQQHEYEAIARKSNGCTKFYRAIRKHGASAFDWQILAERVPVDKLDASEAQFIAKLDSATGGYNVCREGVTTRGVKLSEETRRKMSEAKRAPKSAEHRANLGAARRGKKFSVEWRKKIGDSKRGIKQSAEVVERRASKIRGRKRSPEAIANTVASRKANGWKQPQWTESQREKIVSALKGRSFTKEWRLKIGEGIRRYWEKKRADAQTGAP